MATVGYTTSGTANNPVNRTVVEKFTMPENGDITQVAIHFKIFSSSQVRLAIYADDASGSGIDGATLVADLGQTSASASGIATVTVSSVSLTGSTNYWLCRTGIGVGQIGTTTGLQGDFTSTYIALTGFDPSTAWPNPYSGTSQSSYGDTETIYLTYTPTGGTTLTGDAQGAATSAAEGEKLFGVTAYRFRDDDGSESGATWAAAADTDVSIAAGQRIRLRFQVRAPSAGQYQLEVAEDGTENWSKVQVE